MSNVEIDEGKSKGTIERLNDSPFFAFSKPYLDFIGKGKIFGFVYYVMAALNFLIPFAVIYTTIDAGAFKYADYFGAKFIFAIILSWLVIIFASWIGLQLWWNRRVRFVNTSSSEFVATMCFSDIFQTFGEWIGTMFGILGAGVGFIALIFLGEHAGSLFSMIGMDFLGSGAVIIITGPVAGFFIIVISRFLAEQIRLFASLVNNTKDIAGGLKAAEQLRVFISIANSLKEISKKK